MFKETFLFELKYRFRRPATYGYWLVLFLIFALAVAYGNSPASEKANVNSPYAIAEFLGFGSIACVLLASAILGVPVYRDIEHGTKDYWFSYPITERGYLLGRFFGSFVTLLFVVSGMHAGLIVGSWLGPVLNLVDNAERYAPFNLTDYLWPTLILLVPTLFFVGTLFFALVAFTRSVFVTYVGSVIFLIGYLVSSALVRDVEQRHLAGLLDPFGYRTLVNATRYWTPFEQNNRMIPFEGDLVTNRLIFGGLGLLMLLVVLWRFDFQKFLAVKLGRKEKTNGKKTVPAFSLADLPVAQRVFGASAYLRHMLSLARTEFAQIVRDPYFLAILLAGALFLFFDGWFGFPTMGTKSLPTTYYMLEVKDFNYILFVYIILIFFTGETVHRDRAVRFDTIVDALPVPNWVSFGSKLLGLVGVSFVLVNLPLVMGLLNQLFAGYTEGIHLGMYLTDLWLIEWPEYLQLLALTFAVHVLVNSKFVGHIVSIAIWVVLFTLRNVADQDFNLWFYSYAPGYRWSDMNGLGHFGPMLATFHTYWLALGAILLLLAVLFWNRGTETSFRVRLSLARQRFRPAIAAALTVCTLVFVGAGAWIFYNTTKLNIYRSPEAAREFQADYEKQYRRYLAIPQPKITNLQVAIDLYPEERAFEATGVFVMKNRTAVPIDSLHLNVGSSVPNFKIRSLKWAGVELTKIHNDPVHRYFIYRLPKALQPGDSVTVEMKTHAGYRGFPNSGFGREIVANGTFMNAGDLFPELGYSARRELTSEKYRKKYDLPVREFDSFERTDPRGYSNFLFGDDADWMTFAGTVSTVPDQTAILPGYLTKTWTGTGRDGKPRRYISYRQDEVSDLFFSVCSARYARSKDEVTLPDGKRVAVEIFHDPAHTRNVGRFTAGVKDALVYFSREFTPFQFRQLRILEFPRYDSFAQSFPNTVPYSESFGWVADFSDPDKTDYAYYVTAHEVAHQWWGHQVMPSATRGANNIAEALAEYSSHMVLHHSYGPDVMSNRLKYALDQYLGGRSRESKAERPLMDNDAGAYIWYGKGTLTFYALQDLIGEKAVNAALRDYAKATAFRQNAPYTTTDEWYASLQRHTPDSLKYLLDDCLKKIALYENRAKKAEAKKLDGDRYEVKLTVDTKKLYYDKRGAESGKGSTPDYVEVGIFTEDSKNKLGMKQKTPLLLTKRKLAPGEHVLTFTVKGKPLKAGIDPYNKLIDRVSDDNLIDVEL
jgi:ABC-type transport system involved in multi-copper enzyme maturation permease subunit